MEHPPVSEVTLSSQGDMETEIFSSGFPSSFIGMMG